MTLLTVYYTSIASSTLSTANQLWIVHGTDNQNVTQNCSQIGMATGYGEENSQGTSNAWGAGGSAPSASGNGFLLENSILSLEGQTIAAGNWSANIRLASTQGTCSGLAGTLVADIHVRAYKRSSGGTYTSIIDMSLPGQTINATITTYALSGSTGSSTSFVTGDKLYIDVILNITANNNGNSAQMIRINRLSTDTTNHAGDSNAQVVTPGYSPTGTAHTQSVGSRFRQAIAHTQSIGARLRQATNRTQSTPLRFRLAIAASRSIGTRLRLATNRTQSTSVRFLQAIGHTVSTVARLRQSISNTKSEQIRLRQALPYTQSSNMRIRLASKTTHHLAIRLLLASRRAISIGIRIQQASKGSKSTIMRLSLSTGNTKSLGCRLVVAATVYAAGYGRDGHTTGHGRDGYTVGRGT